MHTTKKVRVWRYAKAMCAILSFPFQDRLIDELLGDLYEGHGMLTLAIRTEITSRLTHSYAERVAEETV